MGYLKPEAPIDTLAYTWRRGGRDYAMAETVAEVKAKTLFEKLSTIKAETLGEILHDTLAKDEGPNNW